MKNSRPSEIVETREQLRARAERYAQKTMGMSFECAIAAIERGEHGPTPATDTLTVYKTMLAE